MKTATALLSAWLIAALALMAAPALAAEAAAPAEKPDLAKGQATAEVCQACHSADGTRGAPANPIIAGQFPEYLVKQLHDFKAGKRENAIMQGMAAPLTDEDIVNVAAFYAGKQAKPGAAKNKATVLTGERIWRGGIADRMIPACAGCHGPAGAGLPVQYPMLAGQHADCRRWPPAAARWAPGQRATRARRPWPGRASWRRWPPCPAAWPAR
jgi:cytochrome c553